MTVAWDTERRADALGARRDELVGRLARAISSARELTHDERELVVDDALTYVVMHYSGPIASAAELERVFWAACDFRVKNARAGRLNTVRGGFTRASDAALENVADDSDPAREVERAEERALVEEFTETLAERERRVLRCKYFSDTPLPLGYKQIARRLGISVGAVRAAERSISHSLERFTALYTAGRLCNTRQVAITSLAAGTADHRQAQLAHIHVNRCPHCRPLYLQQVRELRSAAFQRKVAALLPAVPEANEQRRRLRGAWDALCDTLTRPFSHDGTATVAQLASSGAGRGAGTIAALKLAALCASGAGAIGVCAFVVVPQLTPSPPAVKSAPKPASQSEQDKHAATARATPTPAVKRRRSSSSRSAAVKAQGGTGPTAHEQTPASPAPAGAASDGSSEFDPTFQPSAPAAPAPPPATGGPEFP